jgi:hypothetical protein
MVAHDAVRDQFHPAEVRQPPHQTFERLLLHIIKEDLAATGARHDVVAVALKRSLTHDPFASAGPRPRGRIGSRFRIHSDELAL